MFWAHVLQTFESDDYYELSFGCLRRLTVDAHDHDHVGLGGGGVSYAFLPVYDNMHYIACLVALNRLNAIISIFPPSTAIGPLRGKECDWEALFRPVSHPHAGRSSQPPCSEPPKKFNCVIVVL